MKVTPLNSYIIFTIDARTWRGYRLYGPRMGPIDNFSLVTGSDVRYRPLQVNYYRMTCSVDWSKYSHVTFIIIE